MTVPTDDTTLLQGLLNAQPVVELDARDYRIDSPLAIPAGVTLRGKGATRSRIVCAIGDVLRSTFPINASTAAHVRVEGLALVSADGSGVGYADQGGSYITLRDVWLLNCAVGVRLDQSEIVALERCFFDACAVGAWLVNGPDVNSAALAQYTNVIRLSGCSFNGGRVGLLDDGGAVHVVDGGCSFNGHTQWSIRAAGVSALDVTGTNIESMPVHFNAATESGRAVGQCSQVYLGRNVFECGPRAPINAASLGSLKSESNMYTSPGAPCVIAGGPNIAVVDSAGDYYAQAQFCDGPPTHLRKFP